MGIIPTPPNGQILPNVGVLPGSSQMNFGGMIGSASAWNPNALPQLPGWINQIVRQIYDMKTWYGLYTNGEVITPQAYSTGTATVTLGGLTVQGNGTAWDTFLIGRQFRQGLTSPPYTITGVDPFAQTLTLALPFGAPFPPNQTTMTGGYFIVQMYYNLGSNIKYIKQMVNFQMGFKLWLNLTQDYMDNRDAWRITTNFPWGVAPRPADPNGNYVIELWPAPWTQQVLPWNGYIQPPNLVLDSDCLPPYIRCDVVIKEAMCWALRYKPKENPGYDPQTALSLANTFHQEYMALLLDMANADENLYRTSATIPGEDLPFYTPGGALWDAQHATMAAGGWGDEGW
jgi:hypothetical protein